MKIGLITKTLLVSAITMPMLISMANCSSDNSKLLIEGGSINLVAQTSGLDNYLWSSQLDNENVSDITFWSIEPEIKGVYFRYDVKQKGITILWKDMQPGVYSFKVKGEFNQLGLSKIGYSPTIKLFVQGSVQITGGTNEIIGDQNGQYDQRLWSVFYQSKDYSSIGVWGIEGQGDLIDRISAIYDSEKKGAYLKWQNLSPGKYTFIIKCVFQPTAGEYLKAVSNVITLTVSGKDELLLSGGTQYNTVPINMSGRDNEPFKVVRTISGEDVSINCNFEIINPTVNDLFHFEKETDKVFLYWNDSVKQPQLISFKVKITYTAKQLFYPVTFWINFVQH